MRRFLVLLAGVLVLSLQGCVLGVAWLPDSSGFIFTTPKGDLVAYDYAARKQHILFRDEAAATTAWPAISPDGKKIALAHLASPDGKEARIQIVVCTPKGVIEIRTENYKWAALNGKDLEYTTELYWSPDGKKLIVHGQGLANEGKGFDHTALFDLGTKKLQLMENCLPGVFGGSPIRPDGAGFLLARTEGNRESMVYVWVDWAGKVSPIKTSDNDEVREEVPPWTALYRSRWEESNAILTMPMGRLVIDTKKKEERIEKVKRPESHAGKEPIRMAATLANGVEVLLLERPEENKRAEAVRVVTRKKGEDKLTEVIAPIGDHPLMLSIAPNRKCAIVRDWYGYRGKKSDVIYVLNENGQLYDTIEVNVRK